MQNIAYTYLQENYIHLTRLACEDELDTAEIVLPAFLNCDEKGNIGIRMPDGAIIKTAMCCDGSIEFFPKDWKAHFIEIYTAEKEEAAAQAEEDDYFNIVCRGNLDSYYGISESQFSLT